MSGRKLTGLAIKAACVLALLGLAGAVVHLASQDSGRGLLRFYLSLRGIETRTINAPPYTIRCYTGGPEHAPTVVLLHGLGGDGLTSWLRLGPSLARSFRVVAPDLLYGNVKRLHVSSYTLDAERRMVLALMRALSIPRAGVAGISVGGWVAMDLALKDPEAVQSLMLVSPAGLSGSLPTLEKLGMDENTHARDFFGKLFYSPPPLPGFVLEAENERLHQSLRNLRKLLLKLDKAPKLDRQAANLRMPVLIVQGLDDEIIAPENGPRLHSLIPGSRLEMLPECGHAVVWDKGATLDTLATGFFEKTLSAPATGP